MEMIHIPGYTETDKLMIAKKHIIHRQIIQNGISEQQVEFTDDGIRYLIGHYTREAGLRNLEREVGSICRKVARHQVTGHTDKITVTPDQVSDYLGAPKYIKEDRLKENSIGVVTGLAVTGAGGEVLYVEALKMKGTGNFTLTGQMGDVMKESATAAMSYARAHMVELGIEDNFFETNNVHIHLPAGAIPKDGPSAGVAMTTAIVSLLTSTPVRKDIAMTGEVTLQGRVLPVGGIKEKCLAALMHGIKTVILPIANKKDIADIPDNYKKELNFVFVEHLDEALAIALEDRFTRARKSTQLKSGKKGKEPVTPAA